MTSILHPSFFPHEPRKRSTQGQGRPILMWSLIAFVSGLLGLARFVAAGGIAEFGLGDWLVIIFFGGIMLIAIILAIRGDWKAAREAISVVAPLVTKQATTVVAETTKQAVENAVAESPFPTTPEQMRKFKHDLAVEVAVIVIAELKKAEAPKVVT